MQLVELGGHAWSVEAHYTPMRGKDQDAYCVGANSAAVVDGATPLADDWPQDIAVFAQRTADLLVEESEADIHADDTAVWMRVVRRLALDFEPAGYRRTAGAALVRGWGSRIHFSTVGDVTCLIAARGESILIIDNRLPRLDEEADISPNREAALRENRRLANQPGGYPVVGDDAMVGLRATSRVLLPSLVDCFWLMTDGWWRTLPSNPAEAVSHLLSYESALEHPLPEFNDDATLLCFRPIQAIPR